MSLQNLLKNVDRGIFTDAKAQKMDAVTFFAMKAREAGVGIDGKEWDARKSAMFDRYKIGERQHGSLKAEAVAKYARDSWVLEKAFAELGIKTRGRDASTVEKAFATGTSTVLFPVFIDSQVVAGLLATSLVAALVTAEIGINAHTADHTSMSEIEADRQAAIVAEGARIPTLKISTTDRSIKLKKFAAGLDATYEVLRLQRLNIVSLYLQRMGQQIGIDETDELIQVLISGDGNSGSAVTDTDAEVSGTLDYDEIVRLFLAFSTGYRMGHAIINSTNLRTILNMSEFKDPDAGFNFQRTGQLVNPVGAMWHRWDSTGASAFSTDRILAVDERYAAVQYTEGGTLTESDRIIDQQFEKVTVSKWTGFGKLDYAATKCLDITT